MYVVCMANTSSIDDVERALGVLVACAARVVAVLEPEALPVSAVPAVLGQFVELERLAGAGRLVLAERAVSAQRWKREGFASAAEWLAARQGCSTGRAREDLLTSGRLGGLGDTAAALRRGVLSPEQAGVVADAAVVNPGAEQALLGCAEQGSLKGLRDEAARRKAEVDDVEARAARIRRGRRARSWVGGDGSWNFQAVGPVEAGSGFLVDWERFVAARFDAARRGGEREGRDQYAFDAFINLVNHPTAAATAPGTAEPAIPGPAPGESAAPEPATAEPATAEPAAAESAPAEPAPAGSAASPGPAVDLTPGGSGPPGPVPRAPGRENLRHLGIIRVDLAALLRGTVGEGEVCEIAGMGPIAVSAARGLLGDSILKLVLTRGVDVANVTHLGRGPSTAQQVALLWSQPGCSVRGCNRTSRIEWDHRVPWSSNRVTELANLDGLCEHHHDHKTRHGWALAEGTGPRAFHPPDHPDHPDHPTRGRDPNTR